MKLYRTWLTGLCLVLAMTLPASAAQIPAEVVPGGHTLGIKVYTDGVLIVGTAPVMTAEGEQDPAGLAGLEAGDMITHIDDKPVLTAQDLQMLVKSAGEQELLIRLKRDGRAVELRATPVNCAADGGARLGVWVRDSMAGIGTITFYDPRTGLFGALGHGVNDSANALLSISSGRVIPSIVEKVRPGHPGSPGELKGEFQGDVFGGELLKNTEMGIFGILKEKSMLGDSDAAPMSVAEVGEVKVGPATILTNVRGNHVEEFDVEITRILMDKGKARNFMLRVTDPELIAITGGIVQGMSGSPVLQNGKLAGAVTHVLVNDPRRGYGIFMQNMLKEGVRCLQAGFLAA